jgi:hypothetical protein
MSIPIEKLKPEWKQIYYDDTICFMNEDGTGADVIGIASHIISQYHVCNITQDYLLEYRDSISLEERIDYLLDEILCYSPTIALKKIEAWEKDHEHA